VASHGGDIVVFGAITAATLAALVVYAGSALE